MRNKKILITGGAGFIGSNLCAELLKKNNKLIVIDNLVLGKKDYLNSYFDNIDFTFIKGDLLDYSLVEENMQNIDIVWHLAANSDISLGIENTDIDFDNSIVATYNILKAMRKHNVINIVFASSSAVCGLAEVKPTKEDYAPLMPISLYGAGKLASEALISAFSYNYNIKAVIYRFANIVGRNGTHGVIVDFINKLKHDNAKLQILGNGLQSKPYLYVSECIDGMLYGFENSLKQTDIFNLTPNDNITVKEIADIVVEEMGLNNVDYFFSGTEAGWLGDVPKVELCYEKMKKLGWQPQLTSKEAVRKAVRDLLCKL